ncbi:unnamed protein product [Cylindrotheca closterium]|uniref:Uncharacterized protein n=1 Tax=Cylindrotheca closterium TaxID=2856 RepID=A0AAD2CFX6_9STRA|nr:unnamed protein product [Cylindrotheca closterium]
MTHSELSEEDHDTENDLGSEAAGVVRGFTRSLGRGAARPMIGRLPRQVIRRRLPVKQVARVSDRLSTGYDWWSTAVESQQSSSQRWKQIRAFAGNLVKNTFLGLAVFESYGYVVSQLAPPPSAEVMHRSTYGSSDQTKLDQDYDDDDSEDLLTILPDEPDEFSRASLVSHWTAGAVAGSVHGVATSIFEGPTALTRNIWIQQAAYHTLHHTVAHSVLFGSYEFLKRSILHEFHHGDDIESEGSKPSHLGSSYLAGFALAGGLAGQLQHLISHYTESMTFESGITSTKIAHRLVLARVPAVRPLMMAFPPSAIGFIAFEYGKKLTS